MNLKRITLDDTVEETVNKINENSTDIEENVSRLEADFIPFKDNITLKTSKIEKELNDYKATMQQVNINQEPKQKASGYGVVNLPPNAAEGQVSGVVRGLTATNLIKNGNFAKGATGWSISGGHSSYKIVYEDKSLSFTKIGEGSLSIIQAGNIMGGHKYYISGYIKSTIPFSTPNDNFLYMPETAGQGRLGEVTEQYTRKSYIRERKTNASSYILALLSSINPPMGATVSVKDVMVIDLTATFGAGNEPTKEECDKIFANWFDGTKSTISAFRIRSVSEDESQESVVYVLAKDDEGNIEELRSLPNGTKDEFSLTQGKLIKRVSNEVVLDGSYDWVLNTTDDTKTVIQLSLADTLLIFPNSINSNVQPENNSAIYGYNADMIFSSVLPMGTVGRAVFLKGIFHIALPLPNGTLADAKNYLNNKPVKLIYQLAEPIEIPIQVSGSIASYPSGTIYIERILPDAGVYTDKITILHQDAPIKRLDKLSKVDFMTGVETELDINQAEISEDKLSFTHPDLSEGDIVFFEYEYDLESTQGETEIEYYDSRYTIKDSVTDKFYKWHIIVADGVPSIELVEV